jgi:hypothetical protein
VSLEKIPKRINRAAIVLAGGPSLNWIAPFLKELRDAGGIDIICGVSTISVCAHFDVVPLAAVSVDANAVVWKEQVKEWVPWIKKNQIPLILHPGSDPYLAKHWPGPRWWFLPQQIGVPIFDAMPFMYPEISCHMLNAGCVANTQMEIADLLGHKYVFTAGVDFGFTDGQYGATLYKADGSSWERHHYLVWRQMLRLTKNDVYTTEEMLSYRTNFHLVVRMNYTQTARLTNGAREPGVLELFPRVEVRDLLTIGWPSIAKKHWLTEVQFVERCNKYLESQSIVLAQGDKGPQLVHFGEDDPTMIPTMKGLMEAKKKEMADKAKQSMGDVSSLPAKAMTTVKLSPEKLRELIESGTEVQGEPVNQLKRAGVVQLPPGKVAEILGSPLPGVQTIPAGADQIPDL